MTGVISGVVTPKDKTRKSNPLAVLLIGELSKLQKVSKLEMTGVIIERDMEATHTHKLNWNGDRSTEQLFLAY